jgi:hypothetical protein
MTPKRMNDINPNLLLKMRDGVNRKDRHNGAPIATRCAVNKHMNNDASRREDGLIEKNMTGTIPTVIRMRNRSETKNRVCAALDVKSNIKSTIIEKQAAIVIPKTNNAACDFSERSSCESWSIRGTLKITGMKHNTTKMTVHSKMKSGSYRRYNSFAFFTLVADADSKTGAGFIVEVDEVLQNNDDWYHSSKAATFTQTVQITFPFKLNCYNPHYIRTVDPGHVWPRQVALDR